MLGPATARDENPALPKHPQASSRARAGASPFCRCGSASCTSSRSPAARSRSGRTTSANATSRRRRSADTATRSPRSSPGAWPRATSPATRSPRLPGRRTAASARTCARCRHPSSMKPSRRSPTSAPSTATSCSSSVARDCAGTRRGRRRCGTSPRCRYRCCSVVRDQPEGSGSRRRSRCKGRKAPIPDYLVPVIRRFAEGKAPSDLLFTSPQGGQLYGPPSSGRPPTRTVTRPTTASAGSPSSGKRPRPGKLGDSGVIPRNLRTTAQRAETRKPLDSQGVSVVGDTGIEPVTSSVSGKRATAAPIAHAYSVG